MKKKQTKPSQKRGQSKSPTPPLPTVPPLVVSPEVSEKIKGAGRPFLITPEVEALILEGIGNGQTMVWICEQLKISRQTEYNYRKTHPAYLRRLTSSLERRVEMVEDSLYSKAVSGDVQAQKFFLTNRAGKQWRNLQETQVGGIEEGHPIRIGVKEIIVEIPKSATEEDQTQGEEKKAD